MSDQADSLRQLVRAQRQWRELALRDEPAMASPQRLRGTFMQACGNNNDRPRIRGRGVGLFLARAARWAFPRAGVRQG